MFRILFFALFLALGLVEPDCGGSCNGSLADGNNPSFNPRLIPDPVDSLAPKFANPETQNPTA